MLKSLREPTALVAGLPEDAELVEPAVLTPTLFSGVQTVVMNGIAHLLFFSENPGACGGVEYVIVARLVAPEMRAANCLTDAALHIAKGPPAVERPAN
jgi:hypothetical protein